MTFEEENIKRLGRGIAQCQEVIDAKRRMGGDASDKELANDKRLARRVKHRLEVAMDNWERHSDIKRMQVPADSTGVRLDWSEWWIEWKAGAQVMLQRVSSSAQQHSIQQELEGLAFVMADHSI